MQAIATVLYNYLYKRIIPKASPLVARSFGCSLYLIIHILKFPYCISGSKARLRLQYSKYGKAITQDRMIKLVALLTDLKTREFQRETKTIVLESPSIIIKVWTTHYFQV